MASQADISLYQGDDWAGVVTVLNQDGTPTDLTGYTASAQIRTGPADQTGGWVAAEMTCAVVPVASGQVPNQISLSLTHLETASLREPTYCWDLEIVSPTNVITTLLAGAVAITQEVTREAADEAAAVWLDGPAGVAVWE